MPRGLSLTRVLQQHTGMHTGMTERAQHPLFRAHPAAGVVDVDGVAEPAPYHLYDGVLALIGGDVDVDVARALLADSGLAPITTTAGRALACVWVGDFTAGNLGAHTELQISLLTTPQSSSSPSSSTVPAHRFAALRALAVHEGLRMVCHGLWNNTERVVRYNRGPLALDARHADSAVAVIDGRLRFRFSDAEHQPIAEGDLRAPSKQATGTLWRALVHLGLRGMAAGSKPAVHVTVANTRSAASATVRCADTYAKADSVVIHAIDGDDRLRIVHPRYAPLQFVPGFVEVMRGVRFVYDLPHP